MSLDWSFLKQMRDFNFEDAYRQLTANRSIWWSWGPENVTKLKSGRYFKGISFKVNGYKFQGLVIVTVNGLDYYEVRFVQNDQIVHFVTDIFCDDLVSTIDEYVEKQADYAF